jgi:carboxypeptidase T
VGNKPIQSKLFSKTYHLRFLVIFLASILVITGVWRPEKSHLEAASNPMKEDSVVKISFNNETELIFLVSKLDIWEVHRDEEFVVARISPSKMQELLLAGYSIQIDSELTNLFRQSHSLLPGQTSGFPGYPCYRTLDETYSSMYDLALAYPHFVKLIDIGDSWEKTQPGGEEGYDLTVMKLTNDEIIGTKPVLFLMGAIHARELVTAETVLRFAEYLLSNYGIDPDITWLLNYFEIHLYPQANPDGRKQTEIEEWRKNTDNDDGCNDPYNWGVDLNRNSSFEWGVVGYSPFPCDWTYLGPDAASEPEVQAFENYLRSIFEDQRGPGVSDPAPLDASGLFISLHSYSELILWPWGYTYQDAPNHNQLQTLGRKLAYFNQYIPKQAYDLYPTSGTSDEFAYGELGIAAFTIEMGTAFYQGCTDFENTIFPDNLKVLMIAAKSAQKPFQAPSGPEVYAVEVTPPITDKGVNVVIEAQVDDTRFSQVSGAEPIQVIIEARYSIDTPPWMTDINDFLPLSAVDGSYDESIEAVHATLATSEISVGKHQLFIQAKDAAGNWGLVSSEFFELKGSTQDQVIFIPFLVNSN